ncbi:MAG: esterase-like activity of phytase family protein [Paracoccaceae bacterium]
MLRRFAAAMLIAASSCASTEVDERVALVGEYSWTEPDPDFGGLSAIEVADNGADFIALSDRSLLWSGRLQREGGKVTGITDLSKVALQNGTEQGRGTRDDSEGLVSGGDGTVFISFEGDARLARLGPDGVTEDLTVSPDFASMQGNGSLESLAIMPDGTLLTLPERSGRPDLPFPVYALDDSGWSIIAEIPRNGSFLPVGLDLGPDGRFYLLERDFTGLGFRTRIRQFDAGFTNETTLLKTANARHDNLEGISAWRDDTGSIRLTLVSDDNFLFLQRTEIVEYRVLR